MNVYDFDKTIYDGDSTIDFYLFCLKKQPLLLFLLPYTLFFYLLYKLRIVKKQKFKDSFFIFLKYINNIDKFVNLFWDNNLKKIKSFYNDKHHQSDLIISASPEFLLKPLEKRLNITVIATNFDLKTFKIIGDNCYGDVKVKKYNEFTNKKINEFYSDSYSDKPLALKAKKSFLVKGNNILDWDFQKEEVGNIVSLLSFYIGVGLILFIFNIIVMCALFLFFKINISIIIPITSILFVFMFYFKKIKKKIHTMITIIIFVAVVLSSIGINSKVYDHSWDGNMYHKVAIGMIADGWNPVYENAEDFIDNKKVPFKKIPSLLWINTYAKGVYYYGATLYKVTGDIKVTKSINLISVIAFLLILFSLLLSNLNSKLFYLGIPLSIITLPTITTQLFTNYVDILVYIFIFLLITILFAFEYNKVPKIKNDYYLLYLMVLVLLINIKFSSFVYAGILCLGYYFYYIIKSIKINEYKFLKEITIISAISLVIGIFIVGFSTYPKNTISHYHPFYPLMGKNKVDIMTKNQPILFSKISPIKKNFYSIFSKSGNFAMDSKLNPKLKRPFMIYRDELSIAYSNDMRISGNGVLFSGILIISIILLFYQLIILYLKNKDKFYIYFIPILITLILLFTFGESWWARYFPQIHFIVFLNLILLVDKKKNFSYFWGTLILTLLFFNNVFPIYSSYKFLNKYNFRVKKEINEILNSKCDLNVYTKFYHGKYYNIKNKIINKVDFQSKISNYNLYKKLGDHFYWKCDKNN